MVLKIMSKPDHHVRRELCLTRAPYREGRKPTSVKVYTVNQESKYLLVQGVPAVGAKEELVRLFGSHGDLEEVRTLDDYPSDKFNEVYLINFKKIQSARFAKKRLDDWSFYGGVLHVCYAPEYETVQETREKLQERRRTMAAKIRQHDRDGTYSRNMGRVRSHTSTSTATLTTENQHTPSQDIESNDRTGHVTLIQNNGREQIISNETSTILNTRHVHQYENNVSSQVHQSNNSFLGRIHHHDRSSFSRVTEVSNNLTGQLNPQLSGHNGISSKSNIHGLSTSTISNAGLTHLQLPPPPRHSNVKINKQINSDQCNRFARVPTAHAGFPSNFDARLNKPPDEHCLDNNPRNEKPPEPLQVNEKDDSNAWKTSVKQPGGETVKDLQEKSSEMSPLKTDSVVIKNFSKKGPVPKFIPRQMQSKMKSAEKLSDTKEQKTSANDGDEISKELRRNAFTLREIQGPEDVIEAKRKEPVLQIASVAKSVKEIRKHVSQFSDRNISEIPSKRKKIKES